MGKDFQALLTKIRDDFRVVLAILALAAACVVGDTIAVLTVMVVLCGILHLGQIRASGKSALPLTSVLLGGALLFFNDAQAFPVPGLSASTALACSKYDGLDYITCRFGGGLLAGLFAVAFIAVLKLIKPDIDPIKIIFKYCIWGSGIMILIVILGELFG